mgnify:FL=1|tara:strand:+ start:19464 stop:23444 length:3981 start_codon:yes stop_codon:yes gene_type:complete
MKKNLLFFFLLLSLFVKAQETNAEYVFEYISTKEGLSHNYVSKVVSDSLNVKWIATENGITKYDGVHFTSIQPGLKYPELKSENIETLFIDSKNNLWIGAKSGGLSKLTIETNQLENYNALLTNNQKKSIRVKAIEEDNLGNIWVATNENGLFVINPIQKKIIKTFKTNGITFIIKDANGNIWFNNIQKLKKYDIKKQKLSSYKIGSTIYRAIEDRFRNCLWIRCHDRINGFRLLKFNLNDHSFETVETNVPSLYTGCLFLDKQHRLWIGTWGKGLYISDTSVKNFRKKELVYPPNIKKTFNYDIVLDIHSDKNGVLWISSDFGGIVKLTKNKGFKNIDKLLKNKFLKNELNFHSFYQDKDIMYLGTLRSGLFYGKDFSHLKQISTAEKAKTTAIIKHQNHIVVGNHKNVLFLDTEQQIISKLKINQTTSLYSENDSTLWVGTQQSGLSLVDVKSIKHPKIKNVFTTKSNSHIQSNRISDIVKDNNSNLWLGTYNGLHLFDPESQLFLHHTELTDAYIPSIINTIYVDKKNIWLGTPGGLYKLNFADGKLQIIETYTTEDGLFNDYICGITSDSQGFLWITTASNLVRFDPFEASFINFEKNDGVYTTSFNRNTLVNNLESGIIYAAGTDNLTYFNPEKIHFSNAKNQFLFSYLTVNNKLAHANQAINESIVLKKEISYVEELTVTHLHTSFAIGFSNTNFSINKSLNYRYRLLGYEDHWVPLKNQNEVNFIGLPPGDYELQIASSLDSKNWSDSKSLQLHVLYAPWSSPLAYTIYFLLGFIFIFGFIFILMKQTRLKDKLHKEQELSEAKFTFFTNISHEFRTPLTLIISPLKELMQQQNLHKNLSDKFVTMEKNANRLLNLINQLLDFRKADHGLLNLQVSDGNFVNFSNEVFLYFKEQARIRKIDYHFKSFEDSIQFSFDRNKMEIVLCNLISNALKYSKEGSAIILEISKELNFCKISLKDSGIGMNKEVKKKIFDRFYQIRSTNTSHIIGSGIGLSFTKKIVELHHGTIEVESKPNQGTEFIISIPIDNAHYQEKDLAIVSHNSDKIDNYKKLESPEVPSLNLTNHENTLLIVDDNDEIRAYLKQLLRVDYTILEARDGVEGVKLATKEIPDLILCDIMMPRKDGLAVSKELKSQVTTSHIPIILLTARSSNMYEIQGLETGADDFISKPFDPQIIKARISSALQNRSKIREHFLNKVRFEPTKKDTEHNDPESIFIEEAILLVEENLLNEDFDIKTMMDKLCMSQSSLYRKIKSLTGLSLTGFIRSIRLKKAAEMILSENKKLSTVALGVGFNDYKYFRKSFEKQFDCLPSEYRNIKNKS